MRQRFLATIICLAAVLTPGLAVAYGVQAQDNVTVPKGETRDGTFFASGQSVTIDGDINGDLVCAGSNILVNGAVHGDVLCAGQSVSINGPVDGSARLAGQSVTVGGSVGRNVTAAGQIVTLSSTGKIAGDFGAFGQLVNLDGPVAKTVYGKIQRLTVSNAVGGVDARIADLALTGSGKIAGDLRYTNPASLPVDKTRVSGEIKQTVPAPRQRHEDDVARAGFALRLYWIFAATAIGLVIAWLLPRLARTVGRTMREQLGPSLAWGAVTLLLVPALALVLAITVIGLPLAAVLMVLWGLALGVSSLFTGIAVGQWLLGRADWQTDSLVLAALFGIPLTVIVLSVPGVGAIAGIFTSWWAVGGLVRSLKAARD